MLNFEEYLVPILIAKVVGVPPVITYEVDRYAGVSFFVDDDSRIVTCRHVVEMCRHGEALVGVDLVTKTIHPIPKFVSHPIYDFSTAVFPFKQNYKRFQLTDEAFLPGQDVYALGFTNNGRVGNDVNVEPRLFKGHIVRSAHVPVKADARSTVEISFPSHKGFSGAPLIRTGSTHLAGMLFSNLESSIEIHSFLDVDDQGGKYKEGMFRIIELGLAHSNLDIKKMLSETLNLPDR